MYDALLRLRPGTAALLPCLLVLALPVTAPAQIHAAAGRGDLTEVAALLRQDSSLVGARDEANRTALHLAVRGQHLDVMRLLLDRGASPDAPDQEGRTPLHHAAMNNLTAALALLLERGAALEARDSYGRTALLLCARERGGPEATALLLRAGALVDARDRFGSTPLALAAWRGKAEVVDLLLDAGAAVPAEGRAAQTLLYEATSKGLARRVAALARAGADLAADRTLLHAAAAGGSVAIVDTLLSHGAEIALADQFGWTPLHYAARDGRLGVVDLLVTRGSPLDARNLAGQTALNVASEMKHDTVRVLLTARGADAGPTRFPTLAGDYLGESPPGEEPRLFARGIVSSIWGLHSSLAVAPDGNTVLWAPMVEIPGSVYSVGGILMMERKDGRWEAPRWAPFSSETEGDVPFYAPDGKRVYFISDRPLPGQPASGRERIWFADRSGEGWTAPAPVDTAVNRYPQHWQFSADAAHTLYFASNVPDGVGGGDIYRARLLDGHWQEPESIGSAINSSRDEGMPFIAPDGSYLLFSRDYDLFISYRDANGGWREAQRLPEPINSPDLDICPLVSPDGRYLFFVSQRGGESHIWWVDAGFIARLRPR
ncbi:MAG: hypothetical protein FIB00_00280 [Chloroflexi bacterium]|nr:hypothetical protein [Chloroflexota bacterium]